MDGWMIALIIFLVLLFLVGMIIIVIMLRSSVVGVSTTPKPLGINIPVDPEIPTFESNMKRLDAYILIFEYNLSLVPDNNEEKIKFMREYTRSKKLKREAENLYRASKNNPEMLNEVYKMHDRLIEPINNGMLTYNAIPEIFGRESCQGSCTSSNEKICIDNKTKQLYTCEASGKPFVSRGIVDTTRFERFKYLSPQAIVQIPIPTEPVFQPYPTPKDRDSYAMMLGLDTIRNVLSTINNTTSQLDTVEKGNIYRQRIEFLTRQRIEIVETYNRGDKTNAYELYNSLAIQVKNLVNEYKSLVSISVQDVWTIEEIKQKSSF